MLTNREWATLFWLGALLAFALWKPDSRRGLRGVLSALLTPKLLIPVILFALWMTAVVVVGATVGAWQTSMLKDTLLWSVPGASLVFASTRVAKEPSFFRRRLLQAVGLTAVLEFYLNSADMDLVWELLLQPVLLVAAGVSLVAGQKAELRPAKRLADAAQLVLALGLFVPPTVHLVSAWGTIDRRATGLDFALPMWLTAGALPFVYALSLYSEYEQVLIRVRWADSDAPVPWRVKLALLSSFHLRLRALHQFEQGGPRALAHVKSFREARRAIAQQQAKLAADVAAEREEAETLARYAGVKGTDADGRRLDRREFKETAEALGWLHSMQIGRHTGPGGRYQGDLLNDFPDIFHRCGLPEHHGVTLRVSRSGQSWFAWRRTVSGWCLGIGASGPPPNLWYFDGPDPPRGYPGRDSKWGREQFEPTVNWPG